MTVTENCTDLVRIYHFLCRAVLVIPEGCRAVVRDGQYPVDRL